MPVFFLGVVLLLANGPKVDNYLYRLEHELRPPIIVPVSAHIPWLTEKTKREHREFMKTHELVGGKWVKKEAK